MFMSEENNQYTIGDEISLDTNSKEYQELSFHFNTIFNDVNLFGNIGSSSDSKLYGIEGVFPIKNSFTSLNFEKREKNEITAYGWYALDIDDEKKYEDLIYKLKTKGQDKIGIEINISPPTSEVTKDIFICKFIIGECYILFQGDEHEQTKEEKEEIAEKYDTIVRINDNKIKKYEILKPENIQLLYFVKKKEIIFEPKTIQCSASNCKSNEAGADNQQGQDKKMCFCLLSDSYLCKPCHIEYHQSQIFFGEFGVENCEKKPLIVNYQGDCEEPIHIKKEKEKEVRKEKEIVEYFCRDCNRGICSSCRFNNNDKHKDLDIITNLFLTLSLNNNSLKRIKDDFIPKAQSLQSKVNEIQNSNKDAAKSLGRIIESGFIKLFRESNEKFTKEGQKLLSICYQLNFLKDCLTNYNSLYKGRENILKGTKFKQELYWTKRIHYENVLFIINVKETIKTRYKVDKKIFDKIIEKYMNKFKEPISKFRINDDLENKDLNKEKKTDIITTDLLAEITKIRFQKNSKKSQK